MTLANTPNTYTFFRNNQKSIIDLCFHRGRCNKAISSWKINQEEHGSDHLSTSTTWNINPTEFTPTRMWKKSNRNEIHNNLQKTHFPQTAWSQEDTLKAVSILNKAIDQTITKNTALLRPGRPRKQWWNQEQTDVRKKMTILGRDYRRHPQDPGKNTASREATTIWMKQIRKAK